MISDLNELIFLMNELSRDFNRTVEDSERSTFTAPSSLNDRLSTVARKGLVGRLRLQILQQQLQTLHMWRRFSLGWYRKNSLWTLRCRRDEFGLPVGVGENFSDVSKDDLVEYVWGKFFKWHQALVNAWLKVARGKGAYESSAIVFKNLFEEWIWFFRL